ncbi:MAG TPA: CpXC domain-containing protein, partial [Elusimicrobiales bacterium]|nr:CpXC domain-containing protein [Elusimicrobiales bacterium]
MSIKGTFTAECPSCGERFEADLWTVIRGDRDSALKEALISGECDLLMCPACSGIFSCEESFIYLDPGMELMVFVMPESRSGEKERLLEKMRTDYEEFRSSPAASELAPGVKPLYYFGTQALSELLRRDRDMEEETDVMLFMAGERGFKSAPIRAVFSRENDLPFAMPYAGCPCRDHALKAARAILAENDALVRLANLAKLLESAKTQELPFLRGAGCR